MEWISLKKYVPNKGVPIKVKTSWGEIREAVSCEYFGNAYRLTDCTHPLQNCYLHPTNIVGWRFKNVVDVHNLSMAINHYEREKEGEEIINTVFIGKSIWNKIFKYK